MMRYALHSNLKNGLVLVWLLAVYIVFQTFALYRSMHFVSESGFDLDEKIRLKCAILQPSAGDMMTCSILCVNDDSCLAMSMDQLSQCFLYYQCPNLPFNARLGHYGHVYARKSAQATPCLHGSQWDGVAGKCGCRYGFIGKYCQTMAKSCRDLNYNGYNTGRYYANLDIHNDILLPFWASCEIYANINYSTIHVGMNRGVRATERFYDDYVNGFGSPFSTSEWWLGLEGMFQLSQAGYTILVQSAYMHSSFSTFTRAYTLRSNVTISKDSQGYKVKEYSSEIKSWGNSLGYTIESCFGPLEDIPFSASDHDVDGNSTHNCAAEIGSGWWYKDCDPECNFMAAPMAKIKVPGVDVMALSPDSVRILMTFETP